MVNLREEVSASLRSSSRSAGVARRRKKSPSVWRHGRRKSPVEEPVERTNRYRCIVTDMEPMKPFLVAPRLCRHSSGISGVTGRVTGVCRICEGNHQRPVFPERPPRPPDVTLARASSSLNLFFLFRCGVSLDLFQLSHPFLPLPLAPPPPILHCSLTGAPLSPVRLERGTTETLSRLSRKPGPHRCALDYLPEHESSPPERARRT